MIFDVGALAGAFTGDGAGPEGYNNSAPSNTDHTTSSYNAALESGMLYGMNENSRTNRNPYAQSKGFICATFSMILLVCLIVLGVTITYYQTPAEEKRTSERV